MDDLAGGHSKTCRARARSISNLSDVSHEISGFGASTALTNGVLTATEADRAFSVDKGAGLSLLRLGISANGTTNQTNAAKQAIARLALVWAAPWTSASSYKSNKSNIGGTLTNPQAWADSHVEEREGAPTRPGYPGNACRCHEVSSWPGWHWRSLPVSKHCQSEQWQLTGLYASVILAT
jgi:hypothetical protein